MRPAQQSRQISVCCRPGKKADMVLGRPHVKHDGHASPDTQHSLTMQLASKITDLTDWDQNLA